jgi:hypothetical protein
MAAEHVEEDAAAAAAAAEQFRCNGSLPFVSCMTAVVAALQWW